MKYAVIHKIDRHNFEVLCKRQVEAIVVKSIIGAQTPCVQRVGALHLLH